MKPRHQTLNKARTCELGEGLQAAVGDGGAVGHGEGLELGERLQAAQPVVCNQPALPQVQVRQRRQRRHVLQPCFEFKDDISKVWGLG